MDGSSGFDFCVGSSAQSFACGASAPSVVCIAFSRWWKNIAGRNFEELQSWKKIHDLTPASDMVN